MFRQCSKIRRQIIIAGRACSRVRFAAHASLPSFVFFSYSSIAHRETMHPTASQSARIASASERDSNSSVNSRLRRTSEIHQTCYPAQKGMLRQIERVCDLSLVVCHDSLPYFVQYNRVHLYNYYKVFVKGFVVKA